MSPRAGLDAIRGWRAFFWRHPEWWAWLISTLGWLWLYGGDSGDPHRHHRAASASTIAGHWAVMIPAMMFPFLTGHLRVVAHRSLWRRRHRAIAFFLAGYSCMWMALVPAAVITARIPEPVSIPLTLAMAALWQVTPWRRSGMLACHRTEPLAPHGWAANSSCVRYGAAHAKSCVVTCWPLMLACVAAHRWMAAMPAFTLLLAMERTAPHGFDPKLRIASALAIVLAIFLVLSAAGQV